MNSYETLLDYLSGYTDTDRFAVYMLSRDEYIGTDGNVLAFFKEQLVQTLLNMSLSNVMVYLITEDGINIKYPVIVGRELSKELNYFMDTDEGHREIPKKTMFELYD